MCDHNKRLSFIAKCSDCFHGYIYTTEAGEKEQTIEIDGYVPSNLGIGGGDYIRMAICLDCRLILE